MNKASLLLRSKKLILIAVLLIGVIVVISIVVLRKPADQKSPQSPLTGLQNMVKANKPSETLKEYTDPSGFTISYPDNLSIVNNEITDDVTYADIQLTSKDVSGSINIKITDSKLTTLNDWLKLNAAAAVGTKEVNLGSLKASEITTNDRELLGALDKGIFFDIEMPKIEQAFWTKVYEKVIANFSFVTPDTTTTSNVSPGDVSFEGEEVVE